MCRAVPCLPYRVIGGVRVLPAKSLAEARQLVARVLASGAPEARIVENSTGVLIKRYDRRNSADLQARA